MVKEIHRKIMAMFFILALVPFITSFNYETNEVKITTGNLTQLGELTDVTIPSPTNGYVLTYNSTSGAWEDQSAAAVGDTNETTRFNTLVGNCSSGYYMRGVLSDGSRVCVEDQTGGGGGGNTTEEMVDAVLGQANGSIEYNDGGDEWGVNQTWFQTFGETLWAILTWDYDYSDLINTPTHLTNFTDDILWTTEFNNTFDSRDNDTTYSALSEFSNDVGFTTNSTMNKTVSCSDIVGSPDSDFCTDEFGAGGGGGNTTEEIVDATLSQANVTITYNDAGDEWGVNQTWADNNFVGQTEYPNLDTDSTDDFDGSWGSLTGVPSGFSDNVDNDSADSLTHLSNFTNDQGFITGYTETDPHWTANSTLVVYDSDTSAWDKNAADDFDGAWSSLTGVPSGFSDNVDNDSGDTLTHLSNFTDDIGATTDTNTEKEAGGIYLYNDSDAIYVNDTVLNATIDSRAGTDTTILDPNAYNTTQFNEDSGQLNIIISWLTSFFDSLFGGKTTDDLTQGSSNLYDNQSWNETKADLNYIELTDSFGGEVSGTYDSLTVNSGIHDDEYIELGDSFGGDVSGTYDNLAVTDNSHQHDLNNITNVGNLDTDSTDDHLPNSANVTCHNLGCSANVTWNGTHSIWW